MAPITYAYHGDRWGGSFAAAYVQTEMRSGVDGAGQGRAVPLVPAG